MPGWFGWEICLCRAGQLARRLDNLLESLHALRKELVVAKDTLAAAGLPVQHQSESPQLVVGRNNG